MTKFTQLPLAELRQETDAIAAEAQHSFGLLNLQQLNWKPSASHWSIAQCLDHLLHANQEMFVPMDATLASSQSNRLFERLPVLPGLFGKMMIKAVSPNFKQKLQAPPEVRPTTSTVDVQIVSRFLTQQRELHARLQNIEHANAGHLVITSPFVRWITYSLLDACRLIVAHERRHLLQAQRVREMPGFPR